jgi:hypothetical protein
MAIVNNYKILIKRGITDPSTTLDLGEPGVDLSTNTFYIGKGIGEIPIAYHPFNTANNVIYTKGIPDTIIEVYDNYTTDNSSNILILCNSTNNFNVKVIGDVRNMLKIKNIGNGLITVDTSGGSIDGQASQTLYQWDAIQVINRQNQNWIII